MGPDPLGIFSAAVLQPKDLNLASGDRFFLYTDGLIEATLLFLSTLRAANARIPVLVLSMLDEELYAGREVTATIPRWRIGPRSTR
jgi:hypothetical protein